MTTMNAHEGDTSSITGHCNTLCPSCGRQDGIPLGESIFGYTETSAVAELIKVSGGIYLCSNCDLIFRFPAPTLEDLRKAYQSMPSDAWSYEAPRHWQWTRSIIESQAPNKKVLDVGCFRGDFLATLPPSFERFGIEPNRQAAAVAEARGITLVGIDWAEPLDEFKSQFGTIVLMDVIEHVHDPAQTLCHLKRLLAPGGLIILFTGDSTPWFVRNSIPFHWYLSLPIHLVQLSRAYIAWLCLQLDLKEIRHRRTSHHVGTFKLRLKESLKARAASLWRRTLPTSLFRRLLRHVPPFKALSYATAPPMFLHATDHFWVVLQDQCQARIAAAQLG